jgi:hypothetical protein
MNIGVALVGVRLVADIDLLSIRQREVDMDLEEAAGPVMLPRIFHHHATSRNPAISFLKRRHVPRDLRVQRFLGVHALKIDVQRGFHLCLLDRCRAGVRARADFKLRMTCSQGSTDELKTSWMVGVDLVSGAMIVGKTMMLISARKLRSILIALLSICGSKPNSEDAPGVERLRTPLKSSHASSRVGISRLSVGGRGMFVRKVAMFMSRSCVLLGFFVLAERMVMLGLMMMMCGGVMVSGR